MKCNYACQSSTHLVARRQLLGGMTALGLGGAFGSLSALAHPASAAQLAKDQKRVLVIYMSGGLSQLESWDPKPKTDTGGPFRAIPTSVPGLHISELLPQTATLMDKLAVIRSINTRNNDHGVGSYQMTRGRNREPSTDYPHLGAICAKALEAPSLSLPGHIRIPGGGRGGDSAYLGPRYSSIGVDGKPPQNSARPEAVSELGDQRRNTFRKQVNERSKLKRRSAETDIYTYSYEQAQELMEQREVFDITKEPQNYHDRYGSSGFGQHCLMARRLMENGVTCVQVSHSNYDTHNENFNFHLEQLGEFDQSFSALIGDLSDRGMMESTLVVVMSEFGRTPRINQYYGRDHWGKSWSICLGGGKVHPGAVIGKTSDNGTEVTDREVDHGDLFHTYLSAIGLDSTATFNIDGRELPLANPTGSTIDELLT